MNNALTLKCGSLLFGGMFLIKILAVAWGGGSTARQANGAETGSATNGGVVALQAEINRLKEMVPDQSHAMKDVGYHFANLWFAGQKKNWPLADFYWSETR